MPGVNQMNESRSKATGSRERCTTKAIPPRWSSDGLLRRPTFPPRETTTTESSTSEAFVYPVRNESRSDKTHSSASSSPTALAGHSDHLDPEDPNYWDMASSRIRSGQTPRTYTSVRLHPNHLVGQGCSYPIEPMGWTARRAYKYQVRLELQT